jgi:hypothetical protein
MVMRAKRSERASRASARANEAGNRPNLPGGGQISQFYGIGGVPHLQNAPFFLNNRYFWNIIISFSKKMTGVGHLIVIDIITFLSTENTPYKEHFFYFFLFKNLKKMFRIYC